MSKAKKATAQKAPKAPKETAPKKDDAPYKIEPQKHIDESAHAKSADGSNN